MAAAIDVGDSLDDAEAAAANGGACVLYTGGFTDPDRLRASGLPVADTLTGAAFGRNGQLRNASLPAELNFWTRLLLESTT